MQLFSLQPVPQNYLQAAASIMQSTYVNST
jgi:hypothetical protein